MFSHLCDFHRPSGGFCWTLTWSAPHRWLSFPRLPSFESTTCSSERRNASISLIFNAPIPLAPSTTSLFWSSVRFGAFENNKKLCFVNQGGGHLKKEVLKAHLQKGVSFSKNREEKRCPLFIVQNMDIFFHIHYYHFCCRLFLHSV